MMTPVLDKIAGAHKQAMTLLIAAALLSGCSISRQILYSPRTEMVSPSWIGARPQSLTVDTQDRLSLTGYYWPGAPGDPDIFVYFHGRNWNADMAANAAQHLVGEGNAVLVASYRGFGRNPGHPTQTGLLRDAQAFIARAHLLAGPQARVWLVGHSIGAAVALHAARNAQVNGVIAMSVFVRLAAAAPKISRAFIPDRWNNAEVMKELNIPVIFIQGGLDRLVPEGSADMLFASYRGPSSLVLGGASRHNPDMKVLGHWINQTIVSMQDHSLGPVPVPPAGWTEKGHRP